MQFRLASIFFAIVAAIGVNAQSLQIDTPTNPIQCLPQLLTWSGGQGPYFVPFFIHISVQPGGQPGAAALVDFGEQSGTSLTWVVNIPAGTSVGLTIRDQTGTVANSAPFDIGSSSDTGCLSESLSVSEGGSTSNGGTTATGATATTTGTGSETTTAATRTTGASGSETTSAAAEETDNAAVRFAQIGSAGVVGAFIAAVLAY